jgi:hypothetical protein
MGLDRLFGNSLSYSFYSYTNVDSIDSILRHQLFIIIHESKTHQIYRFCCVGK